MLNGEFQFSMIYSELVRSSVINKEFFFDMIITIFSANTDFFRYDFSIGFLWNLFIFKFFSLFEVKMFHFWGHIPISHPNYFVSPLSILSVMAIPFYYLLYRQMANHQETRNCGGIGSFSLTCDFRLE